MSIVSRMLYSSSIVATGLLLAASSIAGTPTAVGTSSQATQPQTVLQTPPPMLVPTAQEVKDLAEKYRQTKDTLATAEMQKRKMLGSLYQINRRMKKISEAKGQLTDELIHTHDNVKNIAKLIAQLEVQIENQRQQLKTRLRALYKLSGEGYLAIVFSQNTPQEVDHSLRYLKIITDTDYALLKTYQKNIVTYRQQKDRLRTQVEKLVKIEGGIRKQEKLLLKEHKSKSSLVSELDQNQMKAMAQIQGLKTQTRKLAASSSTEDDELNSLLKPSFFESKGQISVPIVGQITRDFGLVEDEKFKVQLSHKGLFFSATAGTAVTAVFDGQVSFNGWLPTYGWTMILDHGDHYYSVYSHLTRPQVVNNQQFKRGQVIALSGNTSELSGPGIYFEIRHFSETENPKNWLNQKQMQISALHPSVN